MAKRDDVTSKKNATLAAKILKGTVKPTKKQILTMAAIVLDNAPNKYRKSHRK